MLTRTRVVKKAKAVQNVLPQVVSAPHLKGKGRITPFGKAKTTKLTGMVGVQFVSFTYEDVGGTSHLLPGFPTTQTVSLNWPKGAGYAVVFLASFSAAYVDTSGYLVDHHLGQLMFQLGFPNSTSVGCTFLLRDSSTSEGVDMWANGVVLYFTT